MPSHIRQKWTPATFGECSAMKRRVTLMPRNVDGASPLLQRPSLNLTAVRLGMVFPTRQATVLAGHVGISSRYEPSESLQKIKKALTNTSYLRRCSLRDL